LFNFCQYQGTSVAIDEYNFLDPDLLDFCQHQGISVAMDKHDSGTELLSENHGCPDSSEEINLPSNLKVFSIFLKKVYYAALEANGKAKTQKAYIGHS